MIICIYFLNMKKPTLECPNNLGNVYEEHPSATRPKEVNGV